MKTLLVSTTLWLAEHLTQGLAPGQPRPCAELQRLGIKP
jgi:hypothetical protein